MILALDPVSLHAGGKMLKAVVFDVDGTLYPQWQINVMSAPLYLSYHRLVNAYWKVRREVRRNKVKPGAEGLHRYQSKMMAEAQGWDPEQTHRKVEALIYGKWHDFFPKVKIFSGLLAVLAELKNRGLKLGVLSDFPVHPKLEDLGVDGWWDVAFCSEDYHTLKPHAVVFLKMVERLGVLPEEVLYVGNHYRYDVLGGRGAGVHTAHLSVIPRYRSLADFSFRKYDAFIKKFDQLQGRLTASGAEQSC